MGKTDDMRELLSRMYDSFASGDPTVWTENIADDIIGVGTDSDEWWEGRTLIAKVAGTPGPGDEERRGATNSGRAPHRRVRKRRLVG